LVGFAGCILVTGLLAGCCCAQAPGSYRIDPQSSQIEIRVFRSGLLGGFGDNHLIILGVVSGAAQALAGGSWQVNVLGESGSLRVLDAGATNSTRAQVQQTMLGTAVLDVARYKTIELQSRSLTLDKASRSWHMLADLTLHGVTRQLEFPLRWEQEGGRFQVRGSTKLLLRDFNIEPPRVAMGTIKVRNDIDVVYDITLQRQ
jgi:polyisoprenoid-binding protein YceI